MSKGISNRLVFVLSKEKQNKTKTKQSEDGGKGK